MSGVQKREAVVVFDKYFGNGCFKTESLTAGVSVRVRKDMVEKLKEPIKFYHKVDGKEICEVRIEFIVVEGETISELRNICVWNTRSRKYLAFGEEFAKDIQSYLNNEVIEGIYDKQQAFDDAFEKELSSVLVGVKNNTDFVVKVHYGVEFEQTFETLKPFDSSKLYLVDGVLYREIDKVALMSELHTYKYLESDGVIIINGDRCFMENYRS